MKRALAWLVPAAGAAVVVYLVIDLGPRHLAAQASRMGWSMAALLALPLFLYVVHAIGWGYTMSPANRQRAGLWRLTALQAFSYGLSGVIPLQVFVAEPLKLSFLRHPDYDRADLGASVVLNNTINGVAIVLWAIGGLLYLALVLVSEPWLRLALIGATLALCGIVAALVLVQRRGLLCGMLGLAGRLGFRGFSERHLPAARRIDDAVAAFYRERRGAFAASLGCHVVEKLHGVAEFWVIFNGLGLLVSWGTCFFIFAVVSTLDNVLFFVQLGGMEAWVASLLALVRIDRQRVNITAALFRRLRMIFWAIVAALVAWPARRLIGDHAAVGAEESQS
ncbi:MAG: flippase-like domain-containing protein [Myxococcales bacterium]|nr:flippase-like domain-containing protein [Myxococcales bacterium]